MAFEQALEKGGDPQVQMERFIRNDTSVVLLIIIGSKVILLGGDLETGHHYQTGWQAVVGSTVRPTDLASIFKIPHHGSPTGHHDAVWEHMLTCNAIAIMTPFRNGNVDLPKSSDVSRVCNLTRYGAKAGKADYIQSDHHDYIATKYLRHAGKKPRTLRKSVGQVRVRSPIEEAHTVWSIECIGSAEMVCS